MSRMSGTGEEYARLARDEDECEGEGYDYGDDGTASIGMYVDRKKHVYTEVRTDMDGEDGADIEEEAQKYGYMYRYGTSAGQPLEKEREGEGKGEVNTGMDLNVTRYAELVNRSRTRTTTTITTTTGIGIGIGQKGR